MAKDFSKAFYKSKAWTRFRKAYVTQRQVIDGGLCEGCHKQPGIILHHIMLLKKDNIRNANVTLNDDAVAFLCERCHNAIHELDRGRLNNPVTFDEDGDVIDLSRLISR